MHDWLDHLTAFGVVTILGLGVGMSKLQERPDVVAGRSHGVMTTERCLVVAFGTLRHSTESDARANEASPGELLMDSLRRDHYRITTMTQAMRPEELITSRQRLRPMP